MRHEVDWPADDFGQLVGQRLDVPPEPGSRLKLVEQVDVTGGPGITSARWAGEGAARPRARRRPHNPVLPSGPRARVHPPVQRWSDKLVEQRPHTRPRPRGQVSVAATLHRTDHEAPQSRASAARPRARHPPLRCTPNVPPGGTGCGAQGVPRSRGGRLAGGGFVVTPPDDDERMEPVGCIQLWGRGQRYVLTELLFDHGPLRVVGHRAVAVLPLGADVVDLGVGGDLGQAPVGLEPQLLLGDVVGGQVGVERAGRA
jgi:hypothetical protein